MATASQQGVPLVDVPLRADELVSAWRAESRRFMLTTRDPLRLQQRVAARISLVGTRVAATITGRVVSSSRHGTHHRIELVPDDTRIRAVDRLLAAARGEAISHQPRAPRFLATMPVVVNGLGGPRFMTTFSVSENGCGVAWWGPLPGVGAAMDVRLGAGNKAASLRCVVCWIANSGRSATVGVRFIAGARAAWSSMIAEVKASGAPPA
jgi:hypothetical protein